MEGIDERKRVILKAIVQEYILTAEPIGSRTLARRFDLGVSPATIRNEMADLEEMGLLIQPHTSAGRIPTDRGYRFYVDSLMDVSPLEKKEAESIRNNYRFMRQTEIEELIEETTKLLSLLTRHTSLVLSPRFKESFIRHVQIIPITTKMVLLLIVTDTGIIKNRMVYLPGNLSREELDEISSFLSHRLQGVAIEKIDETFIKRLERDLLSRFSLLDLVMDLMRTISSSKIHGDSKLYLGGTTNILEQPEFHDLEKVKMVLNILEHDDLLCQVLSKREKERLNIFIGKENELKEIHDCTLITATYIVKGEAIGRIGILGPKRMEYPRVISIVDFVARMLSDLLSNERLSGDEGTKKRLGDEL